MINELKRASRLSCLPFSLTSGRPQQVTFLKKRKSWREYQLALVEIVAHVSQAARHRGEDYDQGS